MFENQSHWHSVCVLSFVNGSIRRDEWPDSANPLLLRCEIGWGWPLGCRRHLCNFRCIIHEVLTRFCSDGHFRRHSQDVIIRKPGQWGSATHTFYSLTQVTHVVTLVWWSDVYHFALGLIRTCLLCPLGLVRQQPLLFLVICAVFWWHRVHPFTVYKVNLTCAVLGRAKFFGWQANHSFFLVF